MLTFRFLVEQFELSWELVKEIINLGDNILGSRAPSGKKIVQNQY